MEKRERRSVACGSKLNFLQVWNEHVWHSWSARLEERRASKVRGLSAEDSCVVGIPKPYEYMTFMTSSLLFCFWKTLCREKSWEHRTKELEDTAGRITRNTNKKHLTGRSGQERRQPQLYRCKKKVLFYRHDMLCAVIKRYQGGSERGMCSGATDTARQSTATTERLMVGG